jgi:hypothetical protein
MVMDLSYLNDKKPKKEDTGQILEMDVLKRQAIEKANTQALKEWELRQVLDKLYDGVPETAFWLSQIHAFYAKKQNRYREHAVYMFMVRQGIVGAKIIEFFNEQEGFLNGMNWLINRMDGTKYHLNKIKIDEAL